MTGWGFSPPPWPGASGTGEFSGTERGPVALGRSRPAARSGVCPACGPPRRSSGSAPLPGSLPSLCARCGDAPPPSHRSIACGAEPAPLHPGGRKRRGGDGGRRWRKAMEGPSSGTEPGRGSPCRVPGDLFSWSHPALTCLKC